MKIWVVIGEPMNEDVISATLFKNKEDAENFMVATSQEEPYLNLSAKELTVHKTFPSKDLLNG